MAQKECKLHFVLTSNELYYVYYLAIMSALKTQCIDEVILWSFGTPQGEYWQFLDSQVSSVFIDRQSFSALEGKPEIFQCAHMKDYLQWKSLYEHGGIFMDLDTFCIQDVSGMLDDAYEIGAAMNHDSVMDSSQNFHSGVVLARPASAIIKEVMDEAYKLLQKKEIEWGDTGPFLFSKIVMEHLDVVKQIERGVLGGYGPEIWGSDSIYKEGRLWNKSKVVHLYGGTWTETLMQIDPMYIKSSSSLYADLVKQTLFEREWNPHACQSL